MPDKHPPLTTKQLTLLAEWTDETPAWWNYQNLDDRWGNEFLAMAELANEVLELRADLSAERAEHEITRKALATLVEDAAWIGDSHSKEYVYDLYVSRLAAESRLAELAEREKGDDK